MQSLTLELVHGSLLRNLTETLATQALNKRFGKLGLESCKGATGILGCFLKSGKRKFKQAQRRLRTPAPTPLSYGPFLPHLNLAVPSLEKLLGGP